MLAVGDRSRDTVTSICHTKLPAQLWPKRALKSIRTMHGRVHGSVAVTFLHASAVPSSNIATLWRPDWHFSRLHLRMHIAAAAATLVSAANRHRSMHLSFFFSLRCQCCAHRRFDVSDIVCRYAAICYSSTGRDERAAKRRQYRTRQQQLLSVQLIKSDRWTRVEPNETWRRSSGWSGATCERPSDTHTRQQMGKKIIKFIIFKLNKMLCSQCKLLVTLADFCAIAAHLVRSNVIHYKSLPIGFNH